MAQQAPTTQPQSDMQKDVDHWKNRLNAAAANSASITNAPGDAPWSSGFFECFNPIDSCLLTCFCPCVMFGRTHHRLHKDANLQGWSPVNASCIGWYATTCVGLHCVGNLLQKADLRERSQPKLAGDFVSDFLKAWCCSCCDLIQQDKEAVHLLSQENVVVTEAPAMKTEQMSYPQ